MIPNPLHLIRSVSESGARVTYRPFRGAAQLPPVALGSGVLLALLFHTIHAVSHREMTGFVVAAWALAGAGLAARIATPALRIDFDERQLGWTGFRATDPADFADVEAVAIVRETVRGQTRFGPYRRSDWRLEVFAGNDPAPAREAAETLRDQLSAPEDGPPRTEEVGPATLSTLDRTYRRFSGPAVSTVDAVWRHAERLARAADAPLFDLSGEHPLVRDSDQLDASLGERLLDRESLSRPADSPPDGLDVSESPRSLQFRWTTSRSETFEAGCFMAGGVLVSPFVGAALADPDVGLSIWFACPVLSLVPLILYGSIFRHRDHGKNVLKLDEATVTYTTSFPWRRTDEMPLEALEVVRTRPATRGSSEEGRGADWELTLVGDDRRIAVTTDHEKVRAMRRRIHEWYRDLARQTQM